MQEGRRILVADHEDASRVQLARVLRAAGFTVTEVADGVGALERARAVAPAATILEIPLPGLSGYELCRAIKAELGPHIGVIFVTAARTEPYDKVAGLLLGADDYLTKPCAADELLVRLRKVLDGGADGRRARRTLTAREREVLGLLSEGLPHREIAARLYISPKTVATHVENLTRKLGVHSRAQAVALAFREELLPVQRAQPRAGPLG